MSDATRHEVLALSTARGGDETDFDFLAQPWGQHKSPLNFKWLFRMCIFAVLVVLLVLVIVDLTASSGDDSGVPYKNLNCFYPLGGAKVPYGGHVTQDRLHSPVCLRLFTEYFEPSGQYWEDTEEAIEDGEGVFEDEADYSKMVILDIDETALSNIPINVRSEATQEERREWEEKGEADPIPATLNYYRRLRGKGFSVAFLTGRSEQRRESTERNLLNAGYGKQCGRNPAPTGNLCYHSLIMRKNDDDRDAVIYKSAERKRLVDEGFEILASVGDQWSDLLGTDRPLILVKLPNPMYYIP